MLVHRHILLAEMHGLLLKIDLGLLDEDVDSPSRGGGDEKRCGRRTGKQLRGGPPSTCGLTVKVIQVNPPARWLKDTLPFFVIII